MRYRGQVTRVDRQPEAESSTPALIYVSAGNAAKADRDQRMDAKAASLSLYAAQHGLNILDIVKETIHRADWRGWCILRAHSLHPGAKIILADPFDAVVCRKVVGAGLDVLVVKAERYIAPGRRVVTLIHGTFFPKVAWTQTNSIFSDELRKHLPGVVIRRFEWSSKNSPLARHRASFELLLDLGTVANNFPDCEHYLVAHSHGGSVALHCLQNAELKAYVAGVICLNTPFLKYSLRDSAPLISAAGSALGIILMLLMGAGSGFVGFLIGAALLLAAVSYTPAIASVWKQNAEYWISRLVTKSPVVPLLWVRNQDQVPPYLRAVAFSTATPGWVWQIGVSGLVGPMPRYVLPINTSPVNY